MDAGMEPIRRPDHIAMFHGIVMHIIHVMTIIFIVAKGVFPIAALPDTAFALAAAAGMDTLAFRQLPENPALSNIQRFG